MLRRLGEATSRLARVSDAAEFETELCAAACELAGADAAVLWTAIPGGMLLAAVDVGLGIAGSELPPGHGAGTRVAFDRGEREYRTRARASGCRSGAPAPSSRWRRPTRSMGVLTVLWRSEPPEVPERELQLIELLSGEAAVAIQRTATLSELEKLTRVDALTGIGNRRAFDEQLARELKRAEREGTTVALGMFDLDHFKAYNDAHGHPAGDRLLADRGRGLGRLPARHRQPRPLRRRGVRAGRARAAAPRRRWRSSTGCARGARGRDLLGRRRAVGRLRDRRGAAGARRRRALRGQGRRPRPHVRRERYSARGASAPAAVSAM